MQTLGIQLMMKLNYLKEKEINLNQQLEENQFKQEMLLYYFPEDIKEEELLF
jgi:hypothetical protein